MKKWLIIAFFPFITGFTSCSFFAKNENLPTVVTETNTEYLVPEVNISKDLLSPCKDQESLPSQATLADILIITEHNTIIYSECRDKQHSLSKIVEKSLNLKEAE